MKNPYRAKIIAKIMKIIFSQKQNLCWGVYSRPPVYQIWRIYLDLWGHNCKKWVWPTFGCKLGQSDPIVMQLKLDMSCHLLNVYTKFQIDISKHVEEKSGKRGRTDVRTDGRTDGHFHGIIRPFFKRAYKKEILFLYWNKLEDFTHWIPFWHATYQRDIFIQVHAAKQYIRSTGE